MKYNLKKPAVILLQDGTIFYGKAVSKEGTITGEVCFNTGMTGYQEIFSDPSYLGQIMVMASVHIGNYGVKEGEEESQNAKIAGLVCRNFSYTASREASEKTLEEFLNESNLFAITDVDTRALVAHIRDNGSMNAVISTEIDNIEALKELLNQTPDMKGLELASKVSTKEPYCLGNPDAKFRVSVLDLGIKKNILRNLTERGVYAKVFPYNSKLSDLEAFNPHGYLISNGPGDPEPLKDVIELVKQIIEKSYPLFGICLGHQIIALANGISTYKMHNGHRGINHPIKNLITGNGEITSQNHGFAIDKAQTEAHPDIQITHIHLNDGTIAGFKMKSKPCFCVQYHPEAGPGPQDAHYLFDDFISMLEGK